jgi:hypothetical protein
MLLGAGFLDLLKAIISRKHDANDVCPIDESACYTNDGNMSAQLIVDAGAIAEARQDGQVRLKHKQSFLRTTMVRFFLIGFHSPDLLLHSHSNVI